MMAADQHLSSVIPGSYIPFHGQGENPYPLGAVYIKETFGAEECMVMRRQGDL